MDPPSSSSSSLAPGTNKASRFSTLKVFGKLGKNKEKDSPPLPPPKDPYYLNSNRSLVSISTQYAPRKSPGSIHPASSTMSLASSATTADSDAMLSPPSSARIKPKKSGFFSLKKRVMEENELPQPRDDENISMPWNFQHNIHIDEGYGGMPPSWTVSLAEAGFTPDEITAIYSRKQSASAKLSSALDHARSPAVLVNPAPRSTSLPRQYSNASLQSVSSSSTSPPPIPLNSNVSRKIQHRSRQNSSSSSSHALSISLESSSDPKLRPNVVIEQGQDEIGLHRSNGSYSVQSHTQKSSPLGTNSPVSLNGYSRPSTPPRRAYYVANANVVQSPPPAYDVVDVAPKGGYTAEKKSSSQVKDTLNEAERDSFSDDSSQARHTRSETSNGNVQSIVPLTPLTLPDIGSGLGLSDLGFDFDLAFSDVQGIGLSNSSSSFTVPPVVIEDTATKRTTITPSSVALSPSTSLLAAPLFTSGPPASPTDPFPRSPSPPLTPSSPATRPVDEDTDVPLTGSTISTMTNASLRSSAFGASGLFNEIQGMLAPGGMTSEVSNIPRERNKNTKGVDGRITDKDLTPIERLRGYNGMDEEREDDLDDKPRSAEDGWTSPALSESLSPTLPPPSPDIPLKHQNKAVPPQIHQRARPDTSVVANHEGEVSHDLSTLSPNANRHDYRNSSRSSTSTVSTLSTITLTQATPATATSTIIQRAIATKITVGLPNAATGLSPPYRSQNSSPPTSPPLPSISSSLSQPQLPLTVPASPQSSTFGGSEEEEASASSSRMSGSTRTSASSSISPKTDTQTEDDADESGLVYYLDSPLPTQTTFDHVRPQIQKVESAQQPLRSGTFGVKPGERDPYGLDEVEDGSTLDIKSGQKTTSPISARGHGDSRPLSPPLSSAPVRPSILISNDTVTARDGPFTAPASGSSPFSTIVPVTPNQRYGGWLSEVVKPLEEFIDEAINPRDYYLDLTEVAQGGNGSVYAARVSDSANIARLSKLPPLIKAQDVEGQTNGEAMFVAIKSVPLSPSGSTKLDELRRELVLLRGLMHGNILAMHALYVDLVDDSLWIRMELMERSLADVVVLCEEGLVLQERVIARFTHDTLAALKFLRSHNIAHRDVRSDNLLLNSQGILKLTDFSNAIKVSQDSPLVNEAVGILYWQAPEIRAGPYNALQVDIWSVGATVWELAQAAPPFSDTDVPGDRWPRLRKPEIFSPSFHEFLRLCSEPAVSRPDASDLLKNAFVNNTCGRPVIGQLLQQCVAIERVVSQRQELEDGEDEATLMIS